MFDQILLPVDFSEHSALAFGHAGLFARAFGASLELVHVVEQVVHSHPSFWSAEPALADELHRQSMGSAERLLGELERAHAAELGPRTSTRVVSGTVPGALADHAAASGSQLIVMSTHGRTGFARWLMGSVSERLLRVAPCSALVVRGATVGSVPVIRRVLVAVDLSEHSRRALDAALAIARALGAAELEVLHAVASPLHADTASSRPGLVERMRERARAELERFVADVVAAGPPGAVAIEQTLISGSPTTTINEHVAARRPDLLVLGTHGYGGVKRLVLGSVAEALARYSPVTALVVR
jgi:nucleotide-binding universal stress UspA family protein